MSSLDKLTATECEEDGEYTICRDTFLEFETDTQPTLRAPIGRLGCGHCYNYTCIYERSLRTAEVPHEY